MKKRARALYENLQNVCSENDYKINLENSVSRVGGGAMPVKELPTWVVSISSDRENLQKIWTKLRYQTPPV